MDLLNEMLKMKSQLASMLRNCIQRFALGYFALAAIILFII